MSIKIIAVGKIKERYLEEAIKEYTKRLRPFTTLEIVEVKEFVSSDINKNIEDEADAILDVCHSEETLIALAIEGKSFSSEELAKMVDEQQTYSSSRLVFIIGGSNGLSNRVKDRASFLCSFGAMTFPHQLMRVILLEQIYRIFSILHHRKYHK
ncbi:MAG: 23S rRNA (pseudouridine(1915)-N(3))-methyltransferase RlmH [Bacilli bacterium]